MAIRHLITLFFLVSMVSLYSQTNQSELCSSRCGNREDCLCECFFEKGQMLRKEEQYSEAIKQLQVALRICNNKEVQAVIDSIQYHEQRMWIYEGGINGKFAIGNGLGEKVETDLKSSPYRFSDPEPFKKGISFYKEGEKYFFVDRNGKNLTPYPGFNGIITIEGNMYYVIIGYLFDNNSTTESLSSSEKGKNYFYVDWNGKIDPYISDVLNGRVIGTLVGISSSNGEYPAIKYHNYMASSPKLFDLSNWGSPVALGRFVEKIEEKGYKNIGYFNNGLAKAEIDKKWGFIDYNMVEPIKLIYEDAGDFNEGLAKVKKNDNWGFIDNKDSVIIDFNYREAYDFKNGLAKVRKGERTYSFIDRKDSIILETRYNYVRDFNDGLAVFWEDGMWGFIDTLGNVIIKPKYDGAGDFHQRLVWVKLNDKYGFINQNDSIIVELKYDSVGDFNEERAKFRIDSTWGFITIYGNEICGPKYDDVSDFKDGLAWVRMDNCYSFIDRMGLEKINIVNRYVSNYKEGFYKISMSGGYYGFCDSNSVLKINNPEFNDAGDFSEGLAKVRVGERWGFIDKNGNIIIKPKYDEVGDFSEELVKVRVGDCYGFINKKDSFIIEPIYDKVGDFNEKSVMIRVCKKWGFIDNNGKLIVIPKYDEVGDFSEGLAKVRVESFYGFINKKDSFIIEPKYDYARDFNDGLAWVYKSNSSRLWRLIDKESKEISTKFEVGNNFNGGLSIVQINALHGITNKNGDELLPCIYSDIKNATEKTYLLYKGELIGLFFRDSLTYIPAEYEKIAQPHDRWVMVMKNGKWGWVDHKGNIKIPCRYDAATPFSDYSNDTDGYATVLQFGLQFRINKKGEMIWR